MRTASKAMRAPFLERAEETGGLPRFVRREVEEYLGCGILEHGCVRVGCARCGFERLVAFSCKRRSFCPSCLGRRMADTALHLVERVIPEEPSDSLVPVDRGSGLPLPWPTSAWMLLLCGATCVASAGRTRIHGRAARRRVITGSPLLRVLPRRNVGLPGAWTILLLRAVVVHPAGCGPHAQRGRTALAFKQFDALGTQNDSFRGRLPHGPQLRAPTHRRPRHRVRRKARYRLGGLTLRRAGLAPAGR